MPRTPMVNLYITVLGVISENIQMDCRQCKY